MLNEKTEDNLISFATIQTIANDILKITPNSTIALVGSYPQGRATLSSDIDIIILDNTKGIELLNKHLKKVLKIKYLDIYYKLDIKLLTWSEYKKALVDKYAFLYRCMGESYHPKYLAGKAIYLKFKPEMFSKELDAFIDKIDTLEILIEKKRAYNYLASYIFQIGRGLYYLEKTVDANATTTLKDIFKKHLVPLGRAYEKTITKGIRRGIWGESKSLKKEKRREMKNLEEAFTLIKKYCEIVEKKFYKWYKSYI
ncbi:MAG: nucleotidyltransferase domain-containing protein [Candidatus Hodarchaeales archaeon]